MPDLPYRFELSHRFELPALPFERHSLEPEISRAQVDLLYSYHHRRHIDSLNVHVAPGDPRSLAELARSDDETVRHHAQEAWNLVFFWHGLTARSVDVPESLTRQIETAFGGIGALHYQWRTLAEATPDSWTWLVAGERNALQLATSRPGLMPSGTTPLLSIALSEDAYRIDLEGQRGVYFDALWPHLNWEYASLNLETIDGPVHETPIHRS